MCEFRALTDAQTVNPEMRAGSTDAVWEPFPSLPFPLFPQQ